MVAKGQFRKLPGGGVRQGELKYGTARFLRLCPQPASMGLYDRPADRQAHSNAIGFGSVKRLESALAVSESMPGPESRTSTRTPLWRDATAADVRINEETAISAILPTLNCSQAPHPRGQNPLHPGSARVCGCDALDQFPCRCATGNHTHPVKRGCVGFQRAASYACTINGIAAYLAARSAMSWSFILVRAAFALPIAFRDAGRLKSPLCIPPQWIAPICPVERNATSAFAGVFVFWCGFKLIGVYVHCGMPFVVLGIEANCRRSHYNIAIARPQKPTNVDNIAP